MRSVRKMRHDLFASGCVTAELQEVIGNSGIFFVELYGGWPGYALFEDKTFCLYDFEATAVTVAEKRLRTSGYFRAGGDESLETRRTAWLETETAYLR